MEKRIPHLKSLEIQGFKTFATKINFDFAPTITAIVGPNGSGKSNITDAIRWVLVSDSGKLIGRVAAFLDEKKSKNFDQVTGGMGFYECIDDAEAALLLFDACKDWLKERGAEAMDGPINFSENDNFWGLLVEGFIQPSYGVNYNFPYYKDQFEAYGFVTFYEQVSNYLFLERPFPERFWKIADRLMSRSEYQIKTFEYKHADKYIDDLISVYDKAWVFHEHFQPLEKKVVLENMKKRYQNISVLRPTTSQSLKRSEQVFWP